jgi:hypothetical protein
VEVLAEGEKRTRPTPLFRRHCASATDADRIALVRIVGRSLLDTDLMLPAVVEVILIGEALVCAEAEIRQADLRGLVGKADPAEIGDAASLP